MTRPTKAVFPLAGLGRNAAHSNSGVSGRIEMMPIMDKPLIQYAIEDALEGGFTELVFVTGSGRRAKRNGSGALEPFDELQAALELHGRSELLEAVRSFVPRGVECIFVRQSDPGGFAQSVLSARAVIGNQPFAVVLPDELVHADESLLAQMVEHHESFRCSIIGAYEMLPGDLSPCGVVKCTAWLGSLFQIGGVTSRPPEDESRSFGIAGRFIFTPAIFRGLEALVRGAAANEAHGEVRFAEALARLLRQETVLALNFDGARYDCSSKLGYLKAMLAFGLAHPEVGADLASHLEALKLEASCAASSALSRSAM